MIKRLFGFGLGALTVLLLGSYLPTPVPVLQGGTGSTTASSARTALSAAASGANSDITSLSTITVGSISLTNQGAQPTCDASHRGQMWLVTAGSSVADTANICIKLSPAGVDTYTWIAL